MCARGRVATTRTTKVVRWLRIASLVHVGANSNVWSFLAWESGIHRARLGSASSKSGVLSRALLGLLIARIALAVVAAAAWRRVALLLLERASSAAVAGGACSRISRALEGIVTGIGVLLKLGIVSWSMVLA